MRAIGTLSATLGLTLNAEGVESEAQLEQLRLLGCCDVQGYLFSAPRPAPEVPKLLQALAGQPEEAAARPGWLSSRRMVQG